MSQVSRMVRPQTQGPARPGLAWEVVGIVAVFVAGWGAVTYAAGRALGWW